MTWEQLGEHELVVYSTTWCSDCRRLKQHLDEQGVSYREIDIDRDAEAAKRLQEATGRTAIPFVEVDGTCMVRGWHEGKPGKWAPETFLREIEEGLGA